MQARQALKAAYVCLPHCSLVPSEAQGGALRLDSASVVVLDNFIGESERKELLDAITHPGAQQAVTGTTDEAPSSSLHCHQPRH